LGQRLDKLRNAVTGQTTAFFEPALDYCVVKMPRWDIQKLRAADRRIGSEMKSVGEVMAIGRSFPEALQKAIRMLNQGLDGLARHSHSFSSPKRDIEFATDRRLYAIYSYLMDGGSVDTVHQLSKIDKWFLKHLESIAEMEKSLVEQRLDSDLLRAAKKLGFSDSCIARLSQRTESELREQRIAWNIRPYVKQVDTLAGEFDAETNYLYCTYHGAVDDLRPAERPPLLVIGSGPYCIGSSVEFDWCAVNTVRRAREMGEPTIIVNSNPETVSTDYDESDRLYFEELSFERLQDIADFENCKGIILSVGGQIANNLALPLFRAGYPILGTSPLDIDRAENRSTFSSLLNDLGIDQPAWENVSTLHKAKQFGRKVGYPILVRPSYVLSGAAMNIVYSESELEDYLREATVVSRDKPVVMSQFITHAKELEVDGVADHGEIVIEAISEHVENAGVHSGDATVVLPPQRLYLETIRRTKKITRDIVRALNITGPFNIQFIAKDNAIKVIECNVRASRSFPFVSKVTNHNFIRIAAEVLLSRHQRRFYETLELDHVGVKTPQFSYHRLKGANPVAHVEMASTGEVACLGDSYAEAFFRSWLATEQHIEGRRLLLSVSGDSKIKLLPALRRLDQMGWDIHATDGTHDFLSRRGIASTFQFKASDGVEPNVVSLIAEREVDLIVNIPRHAQTALDTDGFRIRRLAIDHHIPLITNLQIAQLFLECLTSIDIDILHVKSWQDFMQPEQRSCASSVPEHVDSTLEPIGV
jgi:carbamoyl-phosphate synthase large subunit